MEIGQKLQFAQPWKTQEQRGRTSPGGLQTTGDQLQGNKSSRQKTLEMQENYH